jgi:hypothetical protein
VCECGIPVVCLSVGCCRVENRSIETCELVMCVQLGYNETANCHKSTSPNISPVNVAYVCVSVCMCICDRCVVH